MGMFVRASLYSVSKVTVERRKYYVCVSGWFFSTPYLGTHMYVCVVVLRVQEKKALAESCAKEVRNLKLQCEQEIKAAQRRHALRVNHVGTQTELRVDVGVLGSSRQSSRHTSPPLSPSTSLSPRKQTPRSAILLRSETGSPSPH